MLTYNKVSGILQDKIHEYALKADSGSNTEFYVLCEQYLTKALETLNDTIYFNRQIMYTAYQDNPYAPMENADDYITQDGLQSALDVVKEVRTMEYKRIMAENNLLMLAGTLVLGILIGFTLGKKKKNGAD